MAKYGISREVNLKQYLPQYVKDEELGDLVQVFEDVLNDMYKSADGVDLVETTEISSSLEAFNDQNDNSELLFKYGANSHLDQYEKWYLKELVRDSEISNDPNSIRLPLPLNDFAKESIDAIKSNQANYEAFNPLTVGENDTPQLTADSLTAIEDILNDFDNSYVSDPSNLYLTPREHKLYLNTFPAQGGSYPTKYPDRASGPHDLLDQGLNMSEPIDITAKGDNDSENKNIWSDSNLITAYNKTGLHSTEVKVPTNSEVPNFNSFFKSETVSETKKDHLSILDKIHKLLDLKDPSLIDFEYIQYFADYLGYDLNLNMFHFENSVVTENNDTVWKKELHAERSPDSDELLYYYIRDNKKVYMDSIEGFEKEAHTDSVSNSYDLGYYVNNNLKKEFIENQVRATIENLPYWYKIKGTDNSLKILLYSFGLVADIHNFYTKNYSTNRQDWEVADVFYNTSKMKTTNSKVNELSEDFTDIPDDYYPTPHFQLKFDINVSLDNTAKTDVLRDMEKYGEMVTAIYAAKPINDVFQGLTGIFRTVNTRWISVEATTTQVYSSDTVKFANDDDDTKYQMKICSDSYDIVLPEELESAQYSKARTLTKPTIGTGKFYMNHEVNKFGHVDDDKTDFESRPLP